MLTFLFLEKIVLICTEVVTTVKCAGKYIETESTKWFCCDLCSNCLHLDCLTDECERGSLAGKGQITLSNVV